VVDAVVAFVIGVVATAGAVDAKRALAPFRIKTFIGDNWDLVYALEIEVVCWERSGLARIGPCCTVDEENFKG